MDNFFPKRQKTINSQLRKAVWDLYIGIGVAEALCPLCGITRIQRNTNSGFECAHIVASKFYTGDTLTTLYAYPSCSSCNNDCSDLCILDYLFVRQRYTVLRKMLWAIYTHYAVQHPDEDHPVAWKVIRHLYGFDRYPAGGGIVNYRPIYEMARHEQLQQTLKRTQELNAELLAQSKLMQHLLEDKITESERTI